MLLLLLLLIGLFQVHGKLTIHLVCHTHDDTGWLWTVDQYYDDKVRSILNTVVAGLDANAKRKFNYAEIAFFARWWDEATSEQKETTRRLVKSGQLEFINGGWCMHDEASPMFNEMVDQTTRGHQFILREFGPHAIPKSTWQVDPFGHTNTQAWLLSAEAGMPSVFWGRMDGNDREERKRTKNLEYIWRGSESLGNTADTFAGQLWGQDGQGGYACPFDFEDYIMGSEVSFRSDVDVWAKKAIEMATKQAENFGTENIMFACGNDFRYTNAGTWFMNFDAIIDKVNEKGDVKMMYSSPREYVDTINRDKTAKFQVRTDDLMPLHEMNHTYWNGYFSSRVAFKRLVRNSWNLLYVSRQVEFFLSVSLHWEPGLSPKVGSSWTDKLEAAVSVSMHHDAISGTAKQHVNGDYALRISQGQDVVESGLDKAMRVAFGDGTFHLCRDLNISLCELTTRSNTGFSVLAWNPRGQTARNFLFQIPVQGGSFKNLNFKVGNLVTQVLPLDKVTLGLPQLYINTYGLTEQEIRQQQRERMNNATHVVVFQADVPPVGMASFNVLPMAESSSSPSSDAMESSFSNGVYRISLDPKTKRVQTITNLVSGVSTRLNLHWGWYEAAAEDCTYTGCHQRAGSDAYMLRTNSSAFHFPGRGQPIETEIIQGPIVTEIRQKLSDWVYHVIRLVNGMQYVEVEYTLGPIPFENEYLEDSPQPFGKEVVLRYETGLHGSNGTFHTDSNGLEMIKRVRNSRPSSYPQDGSWQDEPIATNYYPVNAMISIAEGDKSFAVVVDSTQGGSSLQDGNVELLTHRRTLRNFRGVQEPLNETMCGCNGRGDAQCYCAGLAIRGVHRIVFGRNTDVVAQARQISSQLQFKPVPLFTTRNNLPTVTKSYLHAELPANVHLLTLNTNYHGKVLLRLQHLYALHEHPDLSKPVTINLFTLFPDKQIAAVAELTLMGTLPVDQKYTYTWNTKTQQHSGSNDYQRIPFNQTNLSVTLQPMEIRTFQLTISKSKLNES